MKDHGAASRTVAARLEERVRALALPEGRAAGTPGHATAQAHLTALLDASGLEPYGETFALPYRTADIAFANLIGVAPGRDRSAAPVLIGAHYDTAGAIPGADDNAAAVAIALQVAERLLAMPTERDVVIALFDAEEPPYHLTPLMGSVRFYEDQATGPVHAALILDLVGHDVPVPGLQDLTFVTGMESDPGLEEVMLNLPPIDGVRWLTALNRYVGDMSDHHVFRREQVPYLFLSCGRWQHYHRASDTPDRLAYRKMAAIATGLEGMTRAGAERPLDGPWEAYDTTPTDLATMRAALGGLLGMMGIALNDRSDIDRVAEMMTGQLGL